MKHILRSTRILHVGYQSSTSPQNPASRLTSWTVDNSLIPSEVSQSFRGHAFSCTNSYISFSLSTSSDRSVIYIKRD